MNLAILKIVSGGQTGADRVGLDWAIKNGIPHGGWCPKGRRAEDGSIECRHQLQQNPRLKSLTSPTDRQRLRITVFIAAVILLSRFSPTIGSAAQATQAPKFLLGADISALAGPGRSGRGGTRVYQESGKTNEEWVILMNHGWTIFRLRVFVSPVRNAPNNSLENTIPLAKRIKATGATLLLCIHLSDTWADPQHQDIPVAWRDLDFDALEKQVQTYTQDTIKQLKDAGAMPDWVQVGNEITWGTLWPLARVKFPGSSQDRPGEPYDDLKQWDYLTRILKAGIRGVKSAAGTTPPRIAIHIDKGGSWKVTKWFFDHLNAAHVDYDIIAQSFYPPWHHGTLDQLWENMNQCAQRYGKDFAVVETGYGRPQTQNNEDMMWPQTPEGRLQYMVDVVNTVKKAPHGLSVMYWAPERDVWSPDGSPGPAVTVLDHVTTLTNRPASHVPSAVSP
jgi:arabinogalactan endo-1,4-beta-galactosidase